MKNFKKKYLEEKARRLSVNQVEEARADFFSQNKCLYCYETIEQKKSDFHEACNRKIFGQAETPLLSYSKEQLENLAKKIIHSQMAVTGVQAKVSLSIHRKEALNEVKKLTIVGLYGDYILKPPSEHYEQLPELEHLTMKLAHLCGLKTVPHSLVRLKDKTLCYITKRVDRHKKGKYHMEDMCQLTERLTEDKYKGSHEQVAKTIMKYSSNPLLDVSNFYELVLFCFFTGNADMHLKNFSLLGDALGNYTLSPAYDLLNTSLVIKSDKEELALTLNGKKSKLKYNDFLLAFETSGLNKKVLDNTLENFKYCYYEFENMVKKSFLTEDFKTGYMDLVRERFQRFGLL
jgi:serine/threonine-protein kinase HipA